MKQSLLILITAVGWTMGRGAESASAPAELHGDIAEAVASAFPTATGGPGYSQETAWRLGAETVYDEAMLLALLPSDYRNLSIDLMECDNKRMYTVLKFSYMRAGQWQESELWVDVHDSLMRTASAVREAQQSAARMPQSVTALQEKLWELYFQCCLTEGAIDTEPVRKRIMQLQDPAQVYLVAVYFMECMPHQLPSVADLPETMMSDDDLAADELVFALWAHRRNVVWYCKEALILMAREGNEQALRYAGRLMRDSPGDNPFDSMYQKETEKLLRGEPSSEPLVPRV